MYELFKSLASSASKYPQTIERIARIAVNTISKQRVYDYVLEIKDASGRVYILYVELKSINDLKSNRYLLLAQAARDIYIVKTGKLLWGKPGAVLWYAPKTDIPGTEWAENVFRWLEENGVGVVRDDQDLKAVARAVDHAFSAVYGKGNVFSYIASAMRDAAKKAAGILKNPKVLGTVALVGANVAVSVWEPQDPAQAEVKAALQDALRFANFAWSAYVTVDALVALGSSIALAKGGPIALAAITLLPAIASHAYAAVVGEKPSPYVKAVERSVAPGVSVRVALLDPPDPWLPKKLVVLVNGEAWYAADVSRVANAVDPAVRGARVERGVNGRVVYVTVGERGVGVDVVEVVEGASGGCAYVEVWVRSWDVRVGDVLAGRAPEVLARRVSGPTPRGCNAPQQPPEREAPAGGPRPTACPSCGRALERAIAAAKHAQPATARAAARRPLEPA